MSSASSYDVRGYSFPADVQQCGECAALVLKSNASVHLDWHAAVAAETASKIANAIAESRAAAPSARRRRPGPPTWAGS
jgi:hypothetical protein